jgi:hypothetical protein
MPQTSDLRGLKNSPVAIEKRITEKKEKSRKRFFASRRTLIHPCKTRVRLRKLGKADASKRTRTSHGIINWKRLFDQKIWALKHFTHDCCDNESGEIDVEMFGQLANGAERYFADP